MRREADHRGWWTGAIALVAVFWTGVLVVRPAHYELVDGQVFARIAFMHEHRGVGYAETIAIISMLVASVAAVVHAGYVLALREIPVASAAIAAIAAIVMLPSTAIYMAGMADFPYAHLRWILPAELVAAVVVAVAGLASWRIARRDRERLLLAQFSARGRIGGVEPRGGSHDRQGADERRAHPE